MKSDQMNPLLHNYNSYGNFLRDKFFAQRFNLVPSHYSLELYLESKPEELQAVLDSLDKDTYDLELIFKVWRTSSNDDPTKKPDCPNQYFFCSRKEELCLWFIMEHGRLYMELLYNHSNKEVEQWARTGVIWLVLGRTSARVENVRLLVDAFFVVLYDQTFNLCIMEDWISNFAWNILDCMCTSFLVNR